MWTVALLTTMGELGQCKRRRFNFLDIQNAAVRGKCSSRVKPIAFTMLARMFVGICGVRAAAWCILLGAEVNTSRNVSRAGRTCRPTLWHQDVHSYELYTLCLRETRSTSKRINDIPARHWRGGRRSCLGSGCQASAR